jgi:hypothetical protein
VEGRDEPAAVLLHDRIENWIASTSRLLLLGRDGA